MYCTYDLKYNVLLLYQKISLIVVFNHLIHILENIPTIEDNMETDHGNDLTFNSFHSVSQDRFDFNSDTETESEYINVENQSFSHERNSTNQSPTIIQLQRENASLKIHVKNLNDKIDFLEKTLKARDLQLDYMFQANATAADTAETGRLKIGDDKAKAQLLLGTMNNEILPYIKFPHKEDLHKLEEGSIAFRIMQKMGVDKSDYSKWWANHTSMVWCYFSSNKTRFAERIHLQFTRGEKH